jgi:hypothetical protein
MHGATIKKANTNFSFQNVNENLSLHIFFKVFVNIECFTCQMKIPKWLHLGSV